MLLEDDVAVGAVDDNGGSRMAQGIIVFANFDVNPLGYGTGVVNVFQAGAIVERIVIDSCHAVTDSDARKMFATVERSIPKALDAITNDDAREAGAFTKCICFNADHAVRNGDARQTGTTGECKLFNADHAVGNGDARQTGTTGECRIPDDRHAVGNSYARQTATIGKRILTNESHTSVSRNYTILKTSNNALTKGFNNAITVTMISPISLFYSHASNAGAAFERPNANAIHAGRNSNVDQTNTT